MADTCGSCGSPDADEYGCPHCGPRTVHNSGWCDLCGLELWRTNDRLLDAEFASATHRMVCLGYLRAVPKVALMMT